MALLISAGKCHHHLDIVCCHADHQGPAGLCGFSPLLLDTSGFTDLPFSLPYAAMDVTELLVSLEHLCYKAAKPSEVGGEPCLSATRRRNTQHPESG